MRRGIGLVLPGLLGACAADGPEWGAIEVRASAGQVTGNTVWCSGERRGICDPNYELWAHVNQGAITVSTQTPFLLGVMVRFELEGDTAIAAEARYITASDDDGGGGPQITVATGGWVAPDLISAGLSGRQTGTFHIELGDGGIDGTYDTADNEWTAAMR